MSGEYTGRRFAAVTKSDDTPLNGTKGLYVGGAGDLTVKSDTTAAAVTFKNVPAGTLLPIEVVRVMSTNTTATDIIAIYG